MNLPASSDILNMDKTTKMQQTLTGKQLTDIIERVTLEIREARAKVSTIVQAGGSHKL